MDCAVRSFVVHGEALDQVLTQAFSGADAKLGGNGGFDAVAQRNDEVKVVERQCAGHLAGAFGANLSEFPTACILAQFALGVDVGDVQWRLPSHDADNIEVKCAYIHRFARLFVGRSSIPQCCSRWQRSA